MKTPLAWANLVHQLRRTLVAVAGIAFAVVLIFMQLGFQGSMGTSATKVYDQLDFDIVLASPEYQFFGRAGHFSRRRLFQAEAVPGVQQAVPLYVGVNLWRNPKSPSKRRRNILIVGFNPADPVFRKDTLPDVAGALAELRTRDTVLFDRRSRAEFGTFDETKDQGLETEIGQKRIKLGGQFSLGTGLGADGLLLVSDQTFSRIFGRLPLDTVSLGLLKVKEGSDPQTVARELNLTLPGDVYARTRATMNARERHYWIEGTSVGIIFTLGIMVIVIVGVVFVYQVISSDIAGHLAEYATLKAMGYGRMFLSGVVLQQAVILAGLAYVPAFFVALVLDEVTRVNAGIPIRMTVFRATVVFGMALAMCSFSALLALRKVHAADPADLF